MGLDDLRGDHCKFFKDYPEKDINQECMRLPVCLHRDNNLIACVSCNKAVTYDSSATKKWHLTLDDAWLCPRCAKDVDDSEDCVVEDEQ
jgi:hypothetical protein